MNSCENCINQGKYPNCWSTNVESFFSIKKIPCDKYKPNYPTLETENTELKQELEVYKKATALIIRKYDDCSCSIDEFLQIYINQARKELTK